MKRNKTDIVFSWSSLVKYLGTAGGMLVFALILILNSDSFILTVFAYMVGFCGFVMLLLPFFTGFGGKALCPVCSAEIDVMLGKETYIFCKSCGEYLEADKKKLWQMDINHVADDPKFAAPTPWKDLKFTTDPTLPLPLGGPPVDPSLMVKKGGDRILTASWLEGCCVCGKHATRKETITKVIIMAAAPEALFKFRDKQITLIAEGIPHCDKHSGGVKFGRITSLEGMYLMFRSYAYRNEFRRMNPWQWPWDQS